MLQFIRRTNLLFAVLMAPIASHAGLIASFEAMPNPVAPGAQVLFNAQDSFSTEGAILEYTFDFGDASPQSNSGSPIALHTYALQGVYTSRLTILDSARNEASTTRTIYVRSTPNQAPIANAGGPYTLTLGDPLVLNGSLSTDPDATFGDYLTNFDWDLNGDSVFGDVSGAVVTLTSSQYGGFLTGAGTHPISLRVTDSFGLSSTSSAIVNASEPTATPLPSSLALALFGLPGAWGMTLRRRLLSSQSV